MPSINLTTFYWVGFLLIHLRRLQAVTDCLSEPSNANYCSKPFSVSRRCSCDISAVPRNSIQIGYDIVASNQGTWNVSASIHWQPPTQNESYSYSVSFVPLDEPIQNFNQSYDEYTEYRSCIANTSLDDESCTGPMFDVLVNTSSAEFYDIRFGYEYKLQIQAIRDNLYSAVYTCIAPYEDSKCMTPRSLAPDCYESTQDRSFCSQLPIQTSSKPGNFQVRAYQDTDSDVQILHVRWNSPVQVNGDIIEYHFELFRLANDSDVRLESVNLTREFQIFSNWDRTLFNFTTKIVLDDVLLPEERYELLVKPLVDIHGTFVFYGNEARTVFTLTSDHAVAESVEVPLPLLILLVASLLILITIVVIGSYKWYNANGQNPVKMTYYVPHLPMHTAVDKVSEQSKDKEIMDLDRLVVGELIGMGSYGTVYKGVLTRGEKGVSTVVAIKQPNDSASSRAKEEFLEECRLMIRMLGDLKVHPNISSIVGCVTQSQPYCIVTEYMKYGQLLLFLRKCQELREEQDLSDAIYDLTEVNQIQIALQIAKAMTYLSSMRYYHGDLAARNVLVGEDLLVKVSDFGFARDIYETRTSNLAREDKRPVKWYSPEANKQGVCSEKGDVWSFGVVLYEIFTFGAVPYAGLQGDQVLKRIDDGYRLEQPVDCPDNVYGEMMKCWQYDPVNRPQFKELEREIDRILQEATPATPYLVVTTE